jgi:hypothetical protein
MLGVHIATGGRLSASGDGSGMEPTGIEPTTSCMPCRQQADCSQSKTATTGELADNGEASQSGALRTPCPTPRPKATQSGHDSQFVAALSMLAELPLRDEVKMAAIGKILRV